MTDPHTEHRHDRATGRRIGLHPKLNEWQPCGDDPGAQLALDEHDPDAMDDRAERLRAELDRLDLAKAAARGDALAAVRLAAVAERQATADLAAVVAEARAYGATWRDVAGAVGCTVSNAWGRWAK